MRLFLRRIVSEELKPEHLLLKDPDFPNYVGPNGTAKYHVAAHQLFHQSYSLIPHSALGALIAKIVTHNPPDAIIKIGNSYAYRVPKNKMGTLEFVVNAISFRGTNFPSTSGARLTPRSLWRIYADLRRKS